MTRKDYEAIARIFAGDIASNRDSAEIQHAIGNVGRSIADYMARDNPHFDRDKFYIAAGISRN